MGMAAALLALGIGLTAGQPCPFAADGVSRS